MPSPTREDLDKRIVECWRVGMHSAADIGRRLGLDRMHVGRRITRMVKAKSWPFEAPATHRPAGSPAVALFAPLSLRLSAELGARLRAYCRETGATVSETVAEALDRFLEGTQTKRP